MRYLLPLLLSLAAAAPGAVDPLPRGLDVTLAVKGSDPVTSGALVLVPPGEVPTIVAAFEPPGCAPSTDAGSTIRHRRVVEVEWKATEGDRLSGATGLEVQWRPRPAEGRRSVVQATILYKDHGVDEAGGAPEGACLASGSSTVTLLPGVVYNRSGDGLVHGTSIGIYESETATDVPAIVASHPQLYRPPDVLYRLDATTAGGEVLPGVTLGQLCPALFPGEQEATRFVAVSPRLLEFLREFRLECARQKIDPAAIRILRGYVSPTDRLRLQRSGVKLSGFSRHLYGDAIALIHDDDDAREGARSIPYMTDLDRSGQIDIADADRLADIAKRSMDKLGIFGGLGACANYEGPGPAQGSPYLHVDLRGVYSPFREE